MSFETPTTRLNDRARLNMVRWQITVAALAGVILAGLCPANSDADSVYRSRSGRGTSRVSGKITETSPQEITLQTPNGEQKIPASEVRRIAVDGQPSEVARARARFDDQQFEDCLAELEKIETKPDSQWLQQEIDFLKAASTANISLGGGTVSAKAAGQEVFGFLTKYPDSHLTYPATELYGKLLIAFGQLDAAVEPFGKLTQSNWPQYVLSGHFHQGQALLAQNKLDAASKSYQAIMAMDDDDPEISRWKLLAKCQLARCSGLSGQAESGLQTLIEIIKNGDAENAGLFGCAFNAMGAIYLKEGKVKEARNEYLKTQLLYSTARDAHAEALFQLAKIWGDLNDLERSNQARSLLNSRHRNSWWASQ